MLSSGFTLWEKEAARGRPFTKALGIRGEGARWRFSFCSVRNHSWIISSCCLQPGGGGGAPGRQLWLRKEECLRLWGLRIPLLPPSFHISWDMVRFGFGEGLFALLLWTVALENTDLTSTLLHFPWKCPHIYACVCVFGVCVGTEDGAQEVVKEILEDVVTSAVKGENQVKNSIYTDDLA